MNLSSNNNKINKKRITCSLTNCNTVIHIVNYNKINRIKKVLFMKNIKALFFFILVLFTNSFAQDSWLQTNGPFGGTIKSLFKTKNKHILACTWEGLYNSKDNGNSWEKIFDKNINVIEETKAGIIYLGSSTSFNENDLVFYSTDRGLNWIPTKTQPECFNVTYLESDNNGNIFLGSYSSGLFKSTDKGQSWFSVNNGLQDVSITGIKSNNQLLVLSTAKGGVYISKDYGNSWIPINSGLVNLEINALSIKPNGNIIICNNDGVFETANNNIKWIKLYSGKTKNIFPYSNNELFIITDKGLFYSNDDGKNWTEKNNGFNTLNLNDILYLSGNSLLCSTEKSGIYKTDDKGFFWKSSNYGILNLWATKIEINSKGDVFVGSLGCGIFRTTDNGNSWETINNGLRDFNINDIVIGIDDEIFIATSNGVYRSSNNGNLWQKVELYLDNFDENIKSIHIVNEKGLNKLLIGTYDGLAVSELPGMFFKKTFPYSVDLIWSANKSLFLISAKDVFSNQEIFQSNNNGNTWMEINSGYEKLHFWTIQTDKNNNFYAGTNNGLLYSSNLGKNWSTIKSGFTQYFDWGQSTYSLVKAILILNGGNLYASFDGSGLYFSSNKGANLILDNNGLPNSNFEDIKISPNGYIYLSTSSHGIFKMKNQIR